jgi:type I restriction enzyme, S subunit
VKNHYVVAYNYLNQVDSWTVDTLIFKDIKEEERTPLKDLVTFNKERVNSDEIEPDRDYPYVEVKSIALDTGFIDPTYVKGSDLPTRAKLIGRKGDIILSIVRPERGIIAIIPPELDGCVVSNTFVVLTPKKISSEYLYLLLKDDSVRRELSLMAKGTTLPTLGIKDLKEYALPIKEIPKDMEESANDIYVDWKKQGKAERSLSEIVEDVFVQALVKHEEIMDADEQEQYIIFPYDQLIDRWDIGYYMEYVKPKVQWSVQTDKLGHLGEFKVGAAISAKNEEHQGLPYIRVQDLDDESLYIANEKPDYIDENIAKSYSKSSVSKGNILISRIGSRSALVQDQFHGAIANQNLVILRLNEEVIIPKFLAYYLKTRWAKQQFNMYTSGDSLYSFIQVSSLKEFIIPIPNLEQQRLIVELIEQELSNSQADDLEKLTRHFIHQIKCVEKVYDSLINGNRRALVQMATGSGKTSMVTALLRRLFNAGQVKKVLYLTDRRLIAEQFKQICREKIPEHPCYLLNSGNVIESEKGIWAGVIHEADKDLTLLFDLIILDGFNPKWLWFADRERTEGFVLGIAPNSIKSLPNYQEVLKLFELDEFTFTYDIEQAISDG